MPLCAEPFFDRFSDFPADAIITQDWITETDYKCFCHLVQPAGEGCAHTAAALTLQDGCSSRL
jgi:hypothetical protein